MKQKRERETDDYLTLLFTETETVFFGGSSLFRFPLPQLQEKGVLTPEEFVAAGDFLVSTCPT